MKNTIRYKALDCDDPEEGIIGKLANSRPNFIPRVSFSTRTTSAQDNSGQLQM